MSIKVMSHVWDHSSQAGTELLALLALADYADDDGVCWPSLDKIAQKARIKERYARRIVRDLEAQGEIFTLPQRGQSGGRGYTNLYLVASGMSAYEIETVLIRRFELKPELAARIADYLIILQNGGDFEGEIPADPRLELVPNKGGLQTPHNFKTKKGGLQGPKGGPTGTKRGAYRPPESVIEPSMNPSFKRERPPTKKPKQLKAEKGKNTGSIPAAVEIYREIARRYPDKSQWPRIEAAVDDPGFWQELILDWIGCGFKATNIAGLLDCYSRRELPSTRHGKTGGSNGHSTFRQDRSAGRPTGHDLKNQPVVDPYTGKILQPGEY